VSTGSAHANVSEGVMRHAPCSVEIVRCGSQAQIRHRNMPRAMAIATAIAVSAALVNRLKGAVP